MKKQNREVLNQKAEDDRGQGRRAWDWRFHSLHGHLSISEGEAEGMIAFDTAQGYRHIMKSRALKVAEA